MIAFFFPIILGALIGFTLDDGKIDKSDFKHINKELVNPMVKAYENADFTGAEGIPKR